MVRCDTVPEFSNYSSCSGSGYFFLESFTKPGYVLKPALRNQSLHLHQKVENNKNLMWRFSGEFLSSKTGLVMDVFVESVFMSEKESARHGEFVFRDGKVINTYHGTALTFDGDTGVVMEEVSEATEQVWRIVAPESSQILLS